MRTVTNISFWIVRLTGIVQLGLGAAFWTGHALTYLPIHIVSGSLLVLALWAIAALALVVRAHRGAALFGLVWGLALPAFGMQQATLMIGPMHWIIRVIHLLMGLIAMGVASALAKAILAAIPAHVSHPDIERVPVRERGGQ